MSTEPVKLFHTFVELRDFITDTRIITYTATGHASVLQCNDIVEIHGVGEYRVVGRKLNLRPGFNSNKFVLYVAPINTGGE